MVLPPELACPRHLAALEVGDVRQVDEATELRCPHGCVFPVRGGIPRFAPSASYASAFGLQWKRYRRTQLDSYTGTTISHDRLARCLGGSLDAVHGRSVLEAGCGAGRFTEVLLGAGARVFACDLSLAVEANFENCSGCPDYFVCQADVLELPAAPGAFDMVIALGMVQHTPSPEATIAALARMLKRDGLLILDHYASVENPVLRLLGAVTPRQLLRRVFLLLPAERAMRAAAVLTRVLLRLHRALWRAGPLARVGRSALRPLSPVFDYYDRFPALARPHLEEWAFLDTFDALTDRYKHVRSPDEIGRALRAAGLEVVLCRRGGNGVEAQAAAS